MMGEIENAMIKRLKLANGVAGLLGYTLRSIESYGEQLRSDKVKTVANTTPAVWVTFLGAQKIAGEDDHVWQARFAVIAAHKNARNEAASRLGAGDEVGVYQIANDVRGLFNGHSLGLAIGGLDPQAIRLIKSPELAQSMVNVLAVEFLTDWYEEDAFEAPGMIAAENAARADEPGYVPRRQLGDFANFNVKWEPPVPSDTGDSITVPQE